MIDGLLEAIEKQDDELVNKILAKIPIEKRFSRLQEKDAKGNTAMHYAASIGAVDIVLLLHKKGLAFNTPNKEGETPLSYLINKAPLTFASLLLAALQVNQGDLIKEIVLQKGIIPKSIQWTIENKEEQENIAQPIHAASFRENLDVLALYKEFGQDPHVMDDKGRFPIHYAAMSGKKNAVDKLLSMGVDINAQMKDYEQSPLHVAVSCQQTDLLAHLIQKGADVNARDFLGRTPLYFAIQKRNIAEIKLLIANGADPSLRDYKGMRPIDVAYLKEDSEVLQLLKVDLEAAKAKDPTIGRDYSQPGLNDKLAQFCESMGLKENFLDKEGNCNGWTFLYQYYVGINQEDTYYDMLNYILDWDGTKEYFDFARMPASLQKLQYDDGKVIYKDGKAFFEMLIGDLTWYQSTTAASATASNISQVKRVDQWAIAGNRKYDLKEIFQLDTKTIDKNAITQIVELAKNYPNTWLDITVESELGKHAVSLYITPQGKLKYHDPDFKLKPHATDSSAEVADYLFHSLNGNVIVSDMQLYQFQRKDQKADLSSAHTQFEKKLVTLGNNVLTDLFSKKKDLLPLTPPPKVLFQFAKHGGSQNSLKKAEETHENSNIADKKPAPFRK